MTFRGCAVRALRFTTKNRLGLSSVMDARIHPGDRGILWYVSPPTAKRLGERSSESHPP